VIRIFLILADETASWQIAGLTQLDRVALALNEYAESQSPNEIIQAFIFWRPDVPSNKRWLPRHQRLTHLSLTEAAKSTPAGAQVLDTRLLVHRNGLAKFLVKVAPVRVDDTPEGTLTDWTELSTRFRAMAKADSSAAQRSWRYVDSEADIVPCEKWFLCLAGKPQDGIVSRLLNRPISRMVTRLLLRYPITPTAWTLAMLVLPFVSLAVLGRGDYFGFLAGLAVFQIYSTLDGCDGELARAKYLESEKGGKIDTWTDIFGGFIFIMGLGLGLYRKHADDPNGSNYIAQAMACVLLIALNEWRLRSRKVGKAVSSDRLVTTLYPRHHELVHHSGILLLGENVVRWVIQFTKRDISIFVFFILAVINRPEWILPLWMIPTATVLVLAEIARWKKARATISR
jgi:phosphatidylglycerophosphate synthase